MSALQSNVCATTEDGAVWCWGPNNNGQLGGGITDDVIAPKQVRPINTTAQAVTAGTHTCVLSIDRSVMCLGKNDSGQLGDGTTTNRLDWVGLQRPPGLPTATALKVGLDNTYMFGEDGTLWAVGKNTRDS